MATQNNTQRINFASIKKTVDFPDFLDVQLKSFQSFFQIGTTLEERRNEVSNIVDNLNSDGVTQSISDYLQRRGQNSR